MEMDKEAIDVQKKLEQPIKSFDDIALKEELSADNNLLLEQNYNVAKKIIQNYISIIENTTNSVNLEIEEENGGTPTNKWYNFYIFTHFLKAPLLCRLIIMLILRNGGKML